MKKNLFGALCLLVVLILLIAFDAYRDTRIPVIQDELKHLRQQVTTLTRRFDTRVDLEFVITDMEFDVREKMYDPAVSGFFVVEVKGQDMPDVLYVELLIVMVSDGQRVLEENFIQRIYSGKERVEFTLPLEGHDIKKEQLDMRVEPLSWYPGYSIQ